MLFDYPDNILPKDGDVSYQDNFFIPKIADEYFALLLNNIDWQSDKAVIYGKEIIARRKVAWYADQQFNYHYSGVNRVAKSWTPLLLKIKSAVESVTGESFNACLLNLYHDGEDGMAWHSDSEKELKKHGAIASLSLGCARKFKFKHKLSKEVVDIVLEPGSLLVMKDATQTHWLHSIPKSKKIVEPRVNLTFRQMLKQ